MSIGIRGVAADWHGGQSSPLYALASTGTVLPNALTEARDCLALLNAGQYTSDDITRETPRLNALIAYLEQVPT